MANKRTGLVCVLKADRRNRLTMHLIGLFVPQHHFFPMVPECCFDSTSFQDDRPFEGFTASGTTNVDRADRIELTRRRSDLLDHGWLDVIGGMKLVGLMTTVSLI